jgi:hypothetical protein
MSRRHTGSENISLFCTATQRARRSTRLVLVKAVRLSATAFLRDRARILLCGFAMARTEARRACRHDVKWPARIRSIAESEWHPGQVINLSVTGVLLHMDQNYDIGERVEVEIDFLTRPECKTVVTGVGHVIRENGDPRSAAIHFDLGCTPKVELV